MQNAFNLVLMLSAWTGNISQLNILINVERSSSRNVFQDLTVSSTDIRENMISGVSLMTVGNCLHT